MAAFDLRSASLHLSQYIETSSSYQNTKTLLRFYDPSVIIVPPNKLAADGMVGVSELVDRCYSTVRKVKFSAMDTTKLGKESISLATGDSIEYCYYLPFLQVVLARGCFDDTKVDP